jgi:prepilin peptidase CpaA
MLHARPDTPPLIFLPPCFYSLQGVTASLAGVAVGLVLLFPIYLAGGMGAGDVKALAALGSLFGPAIILQIFLYTALIGGTLSLLHFACTSDLRQKSRALLSTLRAFPYSARHKIFAPEAGRQKQQLPYAAAIALGFIAFRHWGPVVSLPW